MRRSRFLAATVSLALILLAAAASAQPISYKLDPNHTEVGFSVRHFFSRVPGKFNKFEGTIQLDEKNWANSSVNATIDASSVDTNAEKRDNHLRTADFFDVEKYPTLTFKSTKVTPAGDKKLKVEGDLTIRGVTKPVVLDVDYLGAGDLNMGGGRPPMNKAGFEAKTKINRKDFGIVWNRAMDQGGAMLGDDVDIAILVEADKFDPNAAAPAAAAPAKPAEKTADKK